MDLSSPPAYIFRHKNVKNPRNSIMIPNLNESIKANAKQVINIELLDDRSVLKEVLNSFILNKPPQNLANILDGHEGTNFNFLAEFVLEYLLSNFKILESSIELGFNDKETNDKIFESFSHLFKGLIFSNKITKPQQIIFKKKF